MLRHVLQPRRHQHEGRAAVREGPDDPRPPPDLAVDALDPVVRPDPAPAFGREFRVGQRLGEPVTHRPRGRPESHRLQLVRHLPGLPAACLARFPRVDRLQHARHGLSPGHGRPGAGHVARELRPRGALGFATPARAFRAMLGEDAAALLDAYGVGDVPLGVLDLMLELIEGAHAERDHAPLA